MTNQFADKMTRSQQRQQLHSSGELPAECLVSELVCTKETSSYRTLPSSLDAPLVSDRHDVERGWCGKEGAGVWPGRRAA